MVALIRAETAPEDRMVQYGTAYQIPYLAQRLPAYRFINPAIELMTPDFTLYEAWMGEIRSGLQQHRPKFVLITGTPFNQGATGLTPVDDKTPVLAALMAYMGNDYRPRMQGEFGALFERTAP